ncbi:MAG TPA: hypothetical protein ENF21_03400 [Bacteroidetes bacterium]|nr:hypothetical protein [Bacteroidota bacterium]
MVTKVLNGGCFSFSTNIYLENAEEVDCRSEIIELFAGSKEDENSFSKAGITERKPVVDFPESVE